MVHASRDRLAGHPAESAGCPVRGRSQSVTRTVGVLLTLLCASCGQGPWNDPYPPEERGRNILYSDFSIRPKHLDPVRAYSSDEYQFIGQIYEPPLQYHYLKRPYELEPLTATQMPEPQYLDAEGRALPDNAPGERIAFSVYDIRIKPGIRYQPHPAFARGPDGGYLYHSLTEADLQGVDALADFPQTATRELVAADYVYQIKRLAHPRLQSPIFSLMAQYIVGLRDYAERLEQVHAERVAEEGPRPYLDLTRHSLEGAQVLDRYTYRIKLRGRYPQLLYWLAMPFFAPMPPEAERFYSQELLRQRNITLDWYPVGTGAYMLTVNNPNRNMVLEHNPNYHETRYPSRGEPGDRAAGLLRDAGERLPFVDKIVFSREKEDIPRWNKFLQGYYDVSGITEDSFDQAIQFSAGGSAELTPALRQKDIELVTTVVPSSYYMGFNMLDPVVGGYSERARKLRRAISIAIDYEEYISIFLNGRGVAAQGPIPPGIFGYQKGAKGVNPYIYEWGGGEARRRSIAEAKQLLAEAGYPNGRDAETGKPLLVHLDMTIRTGPQAKAELDWLRKQFRKIDLQLDVRTSDYNRFREKMRKGTAQLFQWGWNADYPDPENFLFLLYGPNGKVEHHGENAANYASPEFDRLFQKMKAMENSPQRMAVIQHMLEIARRDAPWIWGLHPKSFILFHSWNYNVKPNVMAHNGLQYRRLDPELRERMRERWNRPTVWSLTVFGAVFLASVIPAVVAYRRREQEAIGSGEMPRAKAGIGER